MPVFGVFAFSGIVHLLVALSAPVHSFLSIYFDGSHTKIPNPFCNVCLGSSYWWPFF